MAAAGLGLSLIHILKEGVALTARLLNHEKIHMRQQQEVCRHRTQQTNGDDLQLLPHVDFLVIE